VPIGPLRLLDSRGGCPHMVLADLNIEELLGGFLAGADAIGDADAAVAVAGEG